jgi:hypothetical protein
MFESLCTPAKIYLIIAVVASVVALYNKVMFSAILMKLLFAMLWTYILSQLCKKGYANISWFLVLFPYVVILLAALRIVNLSQYNSMFSSVGLQGAYGKEGMDAIEQKTAEKNSLYGQTKSMLNM